MLSAHTKLFAGTSSGDLPVQRWFDFGGKSFMNYTGNLRGVDYKEFTGDNVAYGVFEFERSGKDIYDFSRKNNLLKQFIRLVKYRFWGGLGWSELSAENRLDSAELYSESRVTNGTYHEFGVGIGDCFNLFRIDLIRNSEKDNKIIFGINILR